MGKKRNVVMDTDQEQILQQRSTNKYSSRSAYDLPEEFAMIAALENKNGNEETSSQNLTEEAAVKTKKIRKAHIRSKRYLNLKKKVDPQRHYQLSEALDTLLTLSKEKFDATVELNIQTKKENVSGTVTLPNGTGKEKKIAIVNDEILDQIANKKIDFDVLIAKPEDMPKLAKYAKFLGPKGLMPNPKNGTVSAKPEEAAKNLGGNTVSYKTEKKAPLIHMIVGKKSFGNEKLASNIQAIFTVLNPRAVKSASLSSSMGPGIKLDVDNLASKTAE